MKETVLVVGMARSGVALAQLLCAQGKTARLNDRKTHEELKEALSPLEGLSGIEYRLGEAPETLLEGVSLVVVSPGVPLTNPVFAQAAARGIPVVGELELSFRAASGCLIAITGTNGKTTTTTLVGEIFKNAGKRVHVVGNIGTPYATAVLDMRPEDVTVLEVSSFQLETVADFRPQVSAILNITEDHLNRHHTMENYAATKARIFENQKDDDVTVLNYDDPRLRAMEKDAPCRLCWFSRTQTPPMGAFVEDGWIVYGTPKDHRNVCKVDEVGIPGPHNLENALAAAVIAMESGVPAPVIRHTLRTFKGVEHRLEYVRTLDDVRYVNDSKGTNVDSTLKAIDSMTSPTVLIAGGSTKNADMLPLAKAIQNGPISYVVLVGDTAGDIAGALDKVGYTAYEKAGYDFEKAINIARARAVPGGTVLLSPACASFDMFKDFEARGDIFKALVRALA